MLLGLVKLGKMIEYPKMLTLKNAWLSTALVKDTAASKTYRLFGGPSFPLPPLLLSSSSLRRFLLIQ